MYKEFISGIFENFFLIYAICIFSLYLWLAIVSARELIRNHFAVLNTNYDAIISSPFAPMITVIAPAYNESLTIVENIKALLALYYPNFEIVVVNDGSKDNTLEKAIEAFDLERLLMYLTIKYLARRFVVYTNQRKEHSITLLLLINLTVEKPMPSIQESILRKEIILSRLTLIR